MGSVNVDPESIYPIISSHMHFIRVSSQTHLWDSGKEVGEEVGDAGRKRPAAVLCGYAVLGILMLIHHWNELQGNPADNGAVARESGQGAARRLQHPGACLCLQMVL